MKHKIKKYTSLLLVIFIILQLIPSTFASAEALDSHAQKSPVIFTTSAVHTGIAFLSVNGRKTEFHSVSAQSYDYFIEHICIYDASENKSIHLKLPIDHFKEIMKKIPHYFHGSKYKDGSLII